jgi:hypothetical protein
MDNKTDQPSTLKLMAQRELQTNQPELKEQNKGAKNGSQGFPCDPNF